MHPYKVSVGPPSNCNKCSTPFGGVCWLALALAFPMLLGESLLPSLAEISWYTTTFGIVCPAIAALVPAMPVKRTRIKYISTAFGIVSLASSSWRAWFLACSGAIS